MDVDDLKAEGFRVLPEGFARLQDMCCGCGAPELFYDAARECLEHFETPIESRDYGWPLGDRFRYFTVNALDSISLIEHGSGICGSWLTDDGKAALAFLREHGSEWGDEKWCTSKGVVVSGI